MPDRSQAVAVEGRNSPRDDIDAIKKVTPGDVNRVARAWLAFDHAISAVLTPESSGKPTSSRVFGAPESFTPGEVRPVPLPDWAVASLQKLSIPASSVNPTVTMLPNGIRLIVQPETISNTVTVSGHIRNNPGLEAPPGKEGVDRLLDGLFSWGTTTLDRTAFQKALDDIGARVDSGTDFSLQVLSDSFDKGVQLLADNMLHPALPQNAFEINRRELAAAVRGEREIPISESSVDDIAAGLLHRADLDLPLDEPVRAARRYLEIDAVQIRDAFARWIRPDDLVQVTVGPPPR